MTKAEYIRRQRQAWFDELRKRKYTKQELADGAHDYVNRRRTRSGRFLDPADWIDLMGVGITPMQPADYFSLLAPVYYTRPEKAGDTSMMDKALDYLLGAQIKKYIDDLLKIIPTQIEEPHPQGDGDGGRFAVSCEKKGKYPVQIVELVEFSGTTVDVESHYQDSILNIDARSNYRVDQQDVDLFDVVLIQKKGSPRKKIIPIESINNHMESVNFGVIFPKKKIV